jgi:hypothetical protein
MHIFGRHQDGIQPYGGPILDAAGDVYGTTFNGGGGTLAGCSDGCGTVYVLIPASGGYRETILARFGNGGGIGPLTGKPAALTDWIWWQRCHPAWSTEW